MAPPSPAPAPRAGSLAARLAGKPLFWIAIIATLFTVPLVRSIRAVAHLPPPSPILGHVTPFSLVDQYGHRLGTEELRGTVWIAQVFRAHGDGAMTEQMAQLQHHTRGLGQQLHLVSITVDPHADTRAVLARYAKKHRASRRAWSFLTGPRAEVQRAVGGDLGVDLDHVTPAVLSRFVLIDRSARIRGTYDLRREGARDRLLRDAGLLVNRVD